MFNWFLCNNFNKLVYFLKNKKVNDNVDLNLLFKNECLSRDDYAKSIFCNYLKILSKRTSPFDVSSRNMEGKLLFFWIIIHVKPILFKNSIEMNNTIEKIKKNGFDVNVGKLNYKQLLTSKKEDTFQIFLDFVNWIYLNRVCKPDSRIKNSKFYYHFLYFFRILSDFIKKELVFIKKEWIYNKVFICKYKEILNIVFDSCSSVNRWDKEHKLYEVLQEFLNDCLSDKKKIKNDNKPKKFIWTPEQKRILVFILCDFVVYKLSVKILNQIKYSKYKTI